MNLLLIRNIFTPYSTIGELFIDDKQTFYTLELPWNNGANQHNKNCILKGTYNLVITHSPHLGYDTPLLIGVSDRADIRIHIANYPHDILGCIGIGMTKGVDFIGESRIAFGKFMDLCKDKINAGQATLTIK